MPLFDFAMHRTNPSMQRRALTLIEILIALTMTLIILGAMMAAFRYASEGMQENRATMEMANRARSVEDQFRNDLASLTIDPHVYTGTSNPNGYLEIIERLQRDSTQVGTANSYLGDVDDIVAMTIRSRDGVLFRGRGWGDANGNGIVDAGENGNIESPIAEVVWFTSVLPVATTVATTNLAAWAPSIDDTVRLHRRELLIRPDLGTLATGRTLVQANLILSLIDISCRVVPNGATFDIVANDLTDLARRENRFAHVAGALNFPNELNIALLDARAHSEGEDIMLTDIIAFDLQVFSPNANVAVDGGANLVIEPDDPNYVAAVMPVNFGATTLGGFVDLGHGSGNAFTAPTPVFAAGVPATWPTWDSWTPSYESDGINQDILADGGTPLIDEGTNGFDNGGPVAPDDDSERETTPPYASPIRGLQAKIRLIEKGTKKVFQTGIIHSFVPE